MHTVKVPEREEKEEIIYKEIKTESFPNLIIDLNISIQEVWQPLKSMKSRDIIMKL